MIKTENIHPDVQRALYRKIEGNQKLLVQGNFDQNGLLESKPFNSSILDADTNTNPIGQEFYRMAFAKVSIAVPDIEKSKNSDSVVLQPISISSYIDVSEKKYNILSTTQKNQPLSFYQGYQESTDNRFRGHSGITKIGVAQQEYYTYKYTIDWVCPDPVYFEEVFQPSFLKFGAFCTIEFGYGTNTGENRIPDMTIETMRALIKEGNRDRLLKYSPGTYYCDVAQIHNFDWKIDSDGTYTGTLTAVSLGYSPLVEPTKKVQAYSPPEDNDEPEVSLNNNILLDNLTKDLLKTSAEDFSSDELLTFEKNSREIQKLVESSAGFSSVMENFEKLLDKYLEKAGKVVNKKPTNQNIGFPVEQILSDEEQKILYKFKKGVLFYTTNDLTDIIPMGEKQFTRKQLVETTRVDLDLENLQNQYLVQWGWFEDTILKSFFELSSGKETVQEIKSSDKDGEPNKCITSDFLYSLGLHEVILPNKHHPFKHAGKYLKDDFANLNLEKTMVKRLYSNVARTQLDLINGIYDLIDKTFGENNSFTTTNEDIKFQKGPKGEEITQNSKGQYYYIPKDEPDTAVIVPLNPVDVGIIRNMVFPIELYKTHFQGATNLVQAMRGFWNDVSSKYGGYWRFQVGQDQDLTKRIGVTDRRTIDVSNPTEENASEDIEEKIKYPFMFNIYSKNSIVREFDVNLELTSEMATLVRYGNQSDKGGVKIAGLTDVSADAWNLLNNKKLDELELKEINKSKYEKLLSITDKIYKNLSYPAQDGVIKDMYNNEINYQDIPEIKDSKKAKLEKVNSGRFGFYKGVGVYDKNGNMAADFKSVMIYLLTNAKINGSQSLVTQGQIPMPLRISLKLDGIGGLKVGDIFKIDYLPKQYRSKTYFVIEKIDHSVGRSGWTTDINAFMVYDAASDNEENKKTVTATRNQLIELFKKTTFTKEDLDQAYIDLDQELISTTISKVESSGKIGKYKNDGFVRERDKFIKTNDKLVELIEEPLPEDWNYLLPWKRDLKGLKNDLIENQKKYNKHYGELEKFVTERDISEIKRTYDDITKQVNNKLNQINERILIINAKRSIVKNPTYKNDFNRFFKQDVAKRRDLGIPDNIFFTGTGDASLIKLLPGTNPNNWRNSPNQIKIEWIDLDAESLDNVIK